MMQSGYYQPLHASFKLAWMWWISLFAFQQVLFYENNMSFNWFIWIITAAVIIYLYVLIRQRRFFASKHHLYFTRDYRLAMSEFACEELENVVISDLRFMFDYEGKTYHYLIIGQSNRFLQELLEENHVAYSHTQRKAKKEAKKA
ncbi:MAG: hypothetical protein LBI43_01955 [Streptococcaceae bacterium]|jgi:hypothetical protein|nr:hypothetical protein [Streptococcaceae bacterium]